ncbi:radical SAM/SPASM domain-containing protein [Caballeronia sp. BR00000012568055]|uniref:radical SAM/SPASM domain-containing protein n=1 Tax=Caballeronia sp. BR00000012568055 TaxID=2918761 RepID=UPI0023FA1A42|nr:radical SAM protein [Caballeronia sp. BR00000012568055]
MQYKRYVLSADAIEVPANKHTAVYHRERGGLCLLDDPARRVLHGFREGRTIPVTWLESEAADREIELIQQLAARGLLVSNEAPIQPAVSGNKINVIQLILANACNFGCTYCFEGIQGKEMSVEAEVTKIDLSRLHAPDEIKIDLHDSMYASKERFEHQYDPANRHMKPQDAVRYVENALAISRASDVNSVMIQFFGGEPLLNWKAIQAVLERFGNGERDRMQIAWSTVTNGSLITEEIAEAFARYEVAVCVSFDSPTSPSRPLKHGGDSTPLVMEGLRRLQAKGCRVAINAALTSSTWNEFDESIVDLAVDVGAGEIGVVVDFDPGFYARFGGQQIVERLWRVVEYGRYRGVVLTGYWHQIFQLLTGHDAVPERGFKNCSAKGAQLSIEPNGSVFACKAGSTLLGSISQGTALLDAQPYQAHASLRHENPAPCRGCEIEGFCAGLCLGPLEKKYAAIDAVETSACDFYRGITRKHIESLRPFEVATFDLQTH